MADKRTKKRSRLKLPGVLMALAAVGLLLSLDGPRGVAVDSPVETLPDFVRSSEKTAEAMDMVMPLEAMEPTAPLPLGGNAASEEGFAPEEEEPAPWAGPVPESEAVEDTYFDDVVFLGSSRTDGLRLYSGLKQGTYLCATGATVESVFTKALNTTWGKMPLLDAMTKVENCGKIYVMLGVNELGWSGTDIFRDQATLLLQRLQADHPEAKIVIQSILPVSAREEAKGNYVNNERITVYNEVWLELAEEMNIPYLNVAEAVVGEDGCLPRELTFDGVHLNKKGCQLWLDYLRTHSVI